MSAIKLFSTSFSSLMLYAANFLLWKKIISITLFKIITVSRSSTLYLMERLGCQTKRRNCGRESPCKMKSINFLPLLNITPIFPSLPWWQTTFWKKRYLWYLLEKFYQKLCLQVIFSATQSWLILKSSFEINLLIENIPQQDYFSELPLKPLWETRGMAENTNQQPKIYQFSPPEYPS